MVAEVQANDFDDTVLKAATPVLVDFFAAWFGPCVQQTPILEKWASAKGNQVAVVKLIVDTASAIASRYGVMSIPTLILFKAGEECARAVGLQSEAALDTLLAKAQG